MELGVIAVLAKVQQKKCRKILFFPSRSPFHLVLLLFSVGQCVNLTQNRRTSITIQFIFQASEVFSINDCNKCHEDLTFRQVLISLRGADYSNETKSPTLSALPVFNYRLLAPPETRAKQFAQIFYHKRFFRRLCDISSKFFGKRHNLSANGT